MDGGRFGSTNPSYEAIQKGNATNVKSSIDILQDYADGWSSHNANMPHGVVVNYKK
jgi:hypothetical protein